jgi:hypothetical protein
VQTSSGGNEMLEFWLWHWGDEQLVLIAEDEHDVVWFWLEKDKPHECPVCAQYFVVSRIVGNGV